VQRQVGPSGAPGGVGRPLAANGSRMNSMARPSSTNVNHVKGSVRAVYLPLVADESAAASFA
jgi:hypothetical protein